MSTWLLDRELIRVLAITVVHSSLIALIALSGARMIRSAAILNKLLLIGVLLVLAVPLFSLVAPAWSLFTVLAPLESASQVDLTLLGNSVQTTPGIQESDRAALDSAPAWRLAPVAIPVAIWLAGFIALALRRVNDLRVRRSILRGSLFPPVCLSSSTSAVAQSLGIKRGVRLRLSAEVTVPMTWSVVRPILLLPADAVTWDPERLHIVLLHELTHVARLDALSRTFGDLAAVIHWYNPLVNRAVRALRRTAELATDEIVVRKGVCPHKYVDTLVELARTSRSLRMAEAAVRRSELEHRAMALVAHGLSADRTRGCIAGMMICIAFAVVMVTAGIGRPESTLAGEDMVTRIPIASRYVVPASISNESEAEMAGRLHRTLDEVPGMSRQIVAASRSLRTDAERERILLRLLTGPSPPVPEIVAEATRLRSDAAILSVVRTVAAHSQLTPSLITALIGHAARLRSTAARTDAIVFIAATRKLGQADRDRLIRIASGLDRPSARARSLAAIRGSF